MMGHIKFCLTVLGGVLIFEEPFHVNQGVGIILTVLGVTAYAHVKVSNGRRSVRNENMSKAVSVVYRFSIQRGMINCI